MSAIVRLETPRLVLREPDDADVAAIQVYAADPVVVEYLFWGPNNEDDTRRFLADAAAARAATPRRQWDLAIVRRADDRIIGGCRLHLTDPQGAAAADVGYALARDAWGQGFAPEAVLAVIKFAFEVLGTRRVWAIVEPENRRSQRVLEKSGLRRERFLRAHRFAKGRWRDAYVYACYNERL